MNWVNFHMYNDAPTKAFEILCNQLFENWCKNNISQNWFHFMWSMALEEMEALNLMPFYPMVILSDYKRSGFLIVLLLIQIGQIKNSINTALKIRPQIILRYIICVPRDLALINWER